MSVGKLSVWVIALFGKRASENYLLENCPSCKCPPGKCPLGKTLTWNACQGIVLEPFQIQIY